MANNHIGTAFSILKTVASNLGWQYSHGTRSEMALKKYQQYPLLHATVESLQLGQQVTQITFNVVIADKMNTLNTENAGKDLADVAADIGYTENENYPHIMQELYTNFAIELHKVQRDARSDDFFDFPVGMSAVIEDDNDKLAGWLIGLVINVVSPFVTDSAC